MSDAFERRVNLEGAANFRDVGGYPAANGRRVRWRRIFRADNLGELTTDDAERIAGLGIRTLVDFRLPSEREQLPNVLSAAHDVETVEIGFLPEGVIDMLRAVSRGTPSRDQIEAGFVDQYRRFVTDHSAEYGRALALALDERRLPLLVHCTSGKDRTGFAVAALLLALGTPQATIFEDYALTNSYMRDISALFAPSAPPELVSFVMTAQAKYLEAAFEQMQASFGSIDAYLARALGLDDAKRERLIALLTEDAGAVG